MVNEQVLITAQSKPTLPTLAEIAQKFWEELLGGGVTANDTEPPTSVGGSGSRWR